MPVSDSFPEHQHQLTRRRLLATGVGVAAAFGLPRFAATAATAATTASPQNLTATNAALQSVDLSGSWSFTPAGQGQTSITVPGGGWYKQGFTTVGEAVYSRTVTVPDTGQPQSVWIEFGAVNHQATLSVDGRVVGTQTTAFTPSNFDITAYVTPGTTHTISVDVKGRNALKSSSGNYLVPVAADWCEAIPQGIYRSAFLRVYPAVYISDTFVRTSVANQALSYDVSVTNTSASARTVTLTGSLSSDNGTSFSYPTLPSATVTVAAHSTSTVTIGPVAWNLGTTSYWWPNVPYRSGYRAQLHDLAVHAATDDGHTSDATYRFGFREFTQNGAYYYLNGIRANLRGDNLQGADYDRVNNGGVGDAYDTLPGFLPPSGTNGGWPQAVDNLQRLNYNVVRIHQEPASPYMLDVADEMGLMIIDETAIRGSNNTQDFVAGHDNMVNHARALVLRDRNHPAVIRWSQANEPTGSTFDSEQFEQDLYAAMNGNDGTRPISVDAGVGASPNHYPHMTQANFNIVPHYLDGFGHYGEKLWSGTGRPLGDGEYIWPACSSVQGFEWFATATAAKRGKDASDLRPYTLLSAWAGFVPGVRTTDFTPEEGGHPVYGADNLPDPWSNPQIQRIQAGFNPIAAIDLPYWSASGASDSNGDFPLPQAVPAYSSGSTVTRNITVFNDDFTNTSVGFTWTAYLNQARRHGHRVRHHHPHHPARLPGHPTGHLHRAGQRLADIPGAVHQQVRDHHVQRLGRVLHAGLQQRPHARHVPHRQPQQRQAPRHRRQLHRRRSQGRPAERRPALDHQHRSRRHLHSGLHRQRQGARRQRRLLDRGIAAATVDRERRHQPAVVSKAHRRRVLHHRQPRQRTGGRRQRPIDQRRSTGRAVDRQRRHQPAMAAGGAELSGRFRKSFRG